MEVRTLLEDYLTSDSKSLQAHQKKIRDYIEEFKPQTVRDLFDKDNLEAFIFARGEDVSPINTRAALVNLHKVFKEKGYISSKDIFPVSVSETSGLNSKSKKGEINFLSREVNIDMFFTTSTTNYRDEEVELVVKACISLCLGVGYKVTHIERMSIADYDPIKNQVKNPYFKEEKQGSFMKEWVQLVPPALDCIRDFWNYFWSSKQSDDNRNLFIMSVADKRPIDQVRITLNEISRLHGLSHAVNPQDLRANMILHSLYQSNGSSLIDLVRIFGGVEKTFVDSLNKYYETNMIDGVYSFNPAKVEDAPELLDPISTIRNDKTVSRIVRDTKMAQSVKNDYDNFCQVCGKRIELGELESYSEGHHIKPLGIPHHGPDFKDNILVLCPNHHVSFDYGVVAVEPETLSVYIIKGRKIIRTDEKLTVIPTHYINPTYLRYHWHNIFLPRVYLTKKL